MYINKIDDLIDKAIDDFYVSVILEQKDLEKLYKETNFVKYQKEINEIIANYTKSINLTEIKELVKSSDAVHTISETLKRYIAFYLFLTIGFNYSGKMDTYINNVVEFTKNQPEFNFKIDNFFNSESNSLLIKYNMMTHNILTLLTADQAKRNILKVKPDYKDTIIFLNQLGSDFIQKNFIESDENTKKQQAHNIIKTMIVLLLYKVSEKKEFFRLLEMTENLDGDYMFIDIVVPKQKYIDFGSVEQLIGSSSSVKNLAYQLWDFIMDNEEISQSPPMSIEEKILFLIQSGLLIPICDDFLLYHKDSERYDKAIDPNKIKKKEDTKIRYIINKIETTSEYYSDQVQKDEKNKSAVKKNFSVPLLNRKAITVNHNEDVSIINKFINQGKRSIENNDYFNDLIGYKVYPFINFKDFESNGFGITFPSTIDVVRCISMAKEGEFKQNSYNSLQFRVGSKDMVVNIVGFMIPTNLTPYQCLKHRDLINLRDLDDKNKNGFDLMVKYLRKSELGLKKHSSSVYWLFDLDKDIVPNANTEYEQVGKFSTSEQTKKIVSSLYDTILIELYKLILNNFKNKQNLNLQMANKIIKSLESKILNIPKNTEIYTKLEQDIFSLITKIEPEYDKKEDIAYGIIDDGTSIKLPTKPPLVSKNVEIVKIDLSGLNEYGIKLDREMTEGICQHNISWDRIALIQKTNPKMYTDEVYRFIQQYLIENVDQEYVCKSCGHQLNLKKYIIDGVFDDDSQKFVTFSMPMEVALEDIPEYEKFKISIRNIDKMIEKIATIANIPHLMKSSSSIKWKRKAVVKDVIDLLLLNNSILKPIGLKSHKEKSSKEYGVSGDLSNIFIFELDNAIFGFSSKEKDYYKQFKINNILSYMIYLLILEINDSHISFMGTDKKGFCNFTVFDKIYHSLFSGLKIRINSKGDLVNITNYKVLCYLIYIIGCPAIKYGMWIIEGEDESKKKKTETLIHVQKMLVHTVVDIINTVLEISSTPGAHYLYEILSVKTFKKMEATFKNDQIYNKLKSDEKSSIVGEKKDFILTKSNLIQLSGKFEPIKFDDPIRIVCKLPRMYIDKRIYNYTRQYEINNVTNCKEGRFHEWITKGKGLMCNICKVLASETNFNESDSKVISENFKFVRLAELSTKFCIVDGLPHQFASVNNVTKCLKCKNDEKYTYTKNNLIDLESKLEKEKRKQSDILITNVNNIHSHIKKDVSYIEKVVESNKISYDNSKKKGQFYFVDELIDELQTVLGNEINIGDIDSTFLRENSYIINHDHLGYPLDKNVILTDNNKKIIYTQNHSFFNCDVIHYTSYKNGKVNIFYDATTRILLGYKEESKNFVLNKRQDKRLIVNYSIANKLKMLGHKSQFIDIHQHVEYLKSSDIKPDYITNTILSDLVRERVLNLKKIIHEFQRTFFKILNNYSEQQTEENADYFNNKLNLFIEKQKKSLSNINIFDNKGQHMVFKHWKGIVRGIFPEKITEYKTDITNQRTINSDEINKIDENGNMILFFIVSEFIKLLKYNSNKYSKLPIAEFIVEFIVNVFDLFNNEKIITNLDVKRFCYVLSTVTYIQSISDKGSNETEGIYNEHQHQDAELEISQEEKDNKTDIEEENEAIDMEETEDNYESGFDSIQDNSVEVEYSY